MNLRLVLPGVSPTHWAHSFVGSVQTVGRSSSSDLRIDDRGVSRNHARIRTSVDRVELVDLGSRNGTWVNSRPVQRATLSPGDCVQFGPDLVFRVQRNDLETATSLSKAIGETSWRSACKAAKSLIEFSRQTSGKLDSRNWISLYSLSCIVHGHFERHTDRMVVGHSILGWLQYRVNFEHLLALQHDGKRWRVTDHRAMTNDTSALEYDPMIVDQCCHARPLVFVRTSKEADSNAAWKGAFAFRIPSEKRPRIAYGKIGGQVGIDFPRCQLWLEYASFLCQRFQSCIDQKMLTPAQADIVNVIREANIRLTTTEVLARLDRRRTDKFVSIGVTKQYLAELVKRGILNNVRPGGYGFPDWQ